jgi:hypothetical protein
VAFRGLLRASGPMNAGGRYTLLRVRTIVKLSGFARHWLPAGMSSNTARTDMYRTACSSAFFRASALRSPTAVRDQESGLRRKEPSLKGPTVAVAVRPAHGQASAE